MSKKVQVRDALVLGLALFAMFFGAGNLIFPPAIGVEGGSDWMAGYLTYFIVDFGLATLSILAMLKFGGKMEKVTGSIGKVGSTILNCAMVLCVGPLLAIPRCAATSFEMGTAGLLGLSPDNTIGLAVFSVVFFTIVLLAVMRPNKVIDGIGKILTPVLVATLAVLIIVGVANPAAPTVAPRVENLVQVGVYNGYQTMDMIAALAFSILIVSTVRGYGYDDVKSENKVALMASGIAAIFLFAVYGGLAYLGSTTGQLWGEEFVAGTINQAALLTNISSTVLGSAGTAFLVLIVIFACLTTAIGLISACSSYFSLLSDGKIRYRTIAVVMTVFSAVVCNIGLSQIISISAPILTLVYPTAMFLTVMSLLQKGDVPHKFACVLGAITSLVISAAGVLVDTFGVTALAAVHTMPLDNYGFGWLIPTVVAALIGLAIDKAKTPTPTTPKYFA